MYKQHADFFLRVNDEEEAAGSSAKLTPINLTTWRNIHRKQKSWKTVDSALLMTVVITVVLELSHIYNAAKESSPHNSNVNPGTHYTQFNRRWKMENTLDPNTQPYTRV